MKQQSKEQVQAHTMVEDQQEERRPVRVPRLQIETLEERVAPNAIWGD